MTCFSGKSYFQFIYKLNSQCNLLYNVILTIVLSRPLCYCIHTRVVCNTHVTVCYMRCLIKCNDYTYTILIFVTHITWSYTVSVIHTLVCVNFKYYYTCTCLRRQLCIHVNNCHGWHISYKYNMVLIYFHKVYYTYV